MQSPSAPPLRRLVTRHSATLSNRAPLKVLGKSASTRNTRNKACAAWWARLYVRVLDWPALSTLLTRTATKDVALAGQNEAQPSDSVAAAGAARLPAHEQCRVRLTATTQRPISPFGGQSIEFIVGDVSKLWRSAQCCHGHKRIKFIVGQTCAVGPTACPRNV